MNKRTFVTMSCLTLLTAVAGFAQSGDVLRANIPFEFRVGASILPAGQYDVRPQTVPGILLLRGGKSAVMVQTIAAGGGPQTRDTAVLVFHRYDKTYFLSTVWTPGYPQGREIPQSKDERELARSNPMPAPVAVALGRR